MGSGVSLGLASIFLGIAEMAHHTVVTSFQDGDQGRYKDQARYPMNQVAGAENDLAASRGILGRAAQTYDDFYLTGETAAAATVSESEAFQWLKNTASVISTEKAQRMLGWKPRYD